MKKKNLFHREALGFRYRLEENMKINFDIPDKIINNFVKGIDDDTMVPIVVVEWSSISNADIFKQLIDISYDRCRTSKQNNNSRK